MKIHNIRLGFATNSSSSHSIVFLSNDKKVSDSAGTWADFGWEFFTCASNELKRNYFAVVLQNSISDLMGNDWHHPSIGVARAVISEWIGVRSEEVIENGMIDHQSMMSLPMSFHNNFIDEEFVKDFLQFLERDDVLILGGNDNEEKSHDLYNKGAIRVDIPISKENTASAFVCRKDPNLGYWTIFNQETGTKVRFSFPKAGSIETKAPEKSTTPELVDLKITDFCPFGCEFCYQDSTHEGKHAKLGYEIAETLSEMQVFEVAIGGGEPTMHPNFVSFIKRLRSNGIIPNFTTKSLSWLQDSSMREDIIENIGGFAYSVSSAGEINKLMAELIHYGVLGNDRRYGRNDKIQVSIHVVLGVVNCYEFEAILKEACTQNICVTLLGYKTKGRGTIFDPVDDSFWLKTVQDMAGKGTCPTLSIDTVIASKYEKEIKAAKIPSWLFHTKDGKFSAYWDVVANKIGPSSFCDESEMVSLNPQDRRQSANAISERFVEIYASF